VTEINKQPLELKETKYCGFNTMRDWERSPTPEETWSDASGGNENGEWPVKGVVGEEIRLDGTSR